jgi:hypothetical protein
LKIWIVIVQIPEHGGEGCACTGEGAPRHSPTKVARAKERALRKAATSRRLLVFGILLSLNNVKRLALGEELLGEELTSSSGQRPRWRRHIPRELQSITKDCSLAIGI